MPKREWRFLITDILYSIEKIERYTKGMSFSDFKSNELVIDAVIKNFEVIGEAANQIPLKIRKANPDVEWRACIDFRNFLIHGYFTVALKIVWGTIKTNLPVLKNKIKAIKL